MDIDLHSPLIEEAVSVMNRCEMDIPHVTHVARLSLDLFKGLAPLHQYPTSIGELLYCAALLHDIGWSLSPTGSKHHKLSAKLIREHPWIHLHKKEIHIVALIARYHRKKLPSPQHSDYHSLTNNQKNIVSVCAAILRIADSLDRTHRQIISISHVAIASDQCVIHFHSTAPSEKETHVFSLKKDLFEAHFHLPVHLQKR